MTDLLKLYILLAVFLVSDTVVIIKMCTTGYSEGAASLAVSLSIGVLVWVYFIIEEIKIGGWK